MGALQYVGLRVQETLVPMSDASSLEPLNAPVGVKGGLSRRDFWIFLCVFVAYFVSARINLKLVDLRNGEGIIWVPAGIALAAILLRGMRIVPVILAASFVVELNSGQPPLTSLLIAAGNAAEGFVGGYLVNRFVGGEKAFSSPVGVLRYSLLAGGFASLLSATVGTTVLAAPFAGSRAEILATLGAWWAGHALGVLVVTPFLVLLLQGTHHPLHLNELAEMVALLVGLSVVCVISFGPASIFSDRVDTPLFLCVPFLVWVGIRFCPLEASGTCLVLCGFATWGSLHGYGPFASATAMPLSLVAYICVATTMTLTGTATIARQRNLSEQLLENLYRAEQTKELEVSRLTSELEFFRDELIRRVHDKSRPELERQVSERPADSNEVIWFLEAETENVLYVSPSYEKVWGRPREALRVDVHAWLDAVVPEDRGTAILFIGEDFPGDRMETTYRIRRPDGSIRWIFDRGFVIRGPSGRATRYLGLASDITEIVNQGQVIPMQLEKASPTSLRRDASGTR
jgi:PAS domain S-box-containing protein